MSKKITSISRRDARRIAIISQGLHQTAPFGQGRPATVRAIDQLGYVQLDTISVVNRAHHHVLWSRIPGYNASALHHLQENTRQIFEYWSHAAAFLPIRDFRYCLPTMRYFKAEKDGWPKAETKFKRLVLDRIGSEGPLMSRDFKSDEKHPGGWWAWKPAKLALQRLFFEGDLMVRHRRGFQRVYDLTERVLPSHIPTAYPDTQDYAGYLIRRTLRAHGVASSAQMAYLRKGMGQPVSAKLRELVEDREVIPLKIKGVDQTYFSLPGLLEQSGTRIMKTMRILSPFDNAVIQRDRLSALFDYDYQIECYVPQPKRKYGYFCLPLVYGDRFVGRIDAKADRKTGVLYVNSVFQESVMSRETFAAELALALRKFAEFNNCAAIEIRRTDPIALQDLVIRHLQPRS